MAEHLEVVPYVALSRMPYMAAPCRREHRRGISGGRMLSPAAHSDSADSWAAKFSPGLRAELLGGSHHTVEHPHSPTPSSLAHTDGGDSEYSAHTNSGDSEYSMPSGADPRMHCRACFYCTLPPSRCHPLCGMRLCLVCREEDHVESPEGKCTCGHRMCE